MGEMILREDLLAQGYVETWHRLGSVYYEDGEKNVIAKICSKCGLLTNIEDFNKKERGIGGRRADCRKCSSQKTKLWRANNTDHIEVMNEKYREGRIEASRHWRKMNPKKKLAYLNEWRAKHPEKKRISDDARRLRILAQPSTLTKEQQSDIISRFAGCAITGSNEISWDHVIPVITGHGGRTKYNMIPLRADLNSSKGVGNIFEWFRWAADYYGLSQAKFDDLISYLAEVNGMTTKEYRMYVDWCFDNPRDIETEVLE